MNIIHQIKININRKLINRHSNKKIYNENKNKMKKTSLILEKIKYSSDRLRLYFKNILIKSTKISFSLFFLGLVSKYIFMYMRYYYQLYKKELILAQAEGYSRYTDYEEFMNGHSCFELELYDEGFHYFFINEKNALDSFLKIINKYIDHPQFGPEIGNYLLDLINYNPKISPKNDFIQILIDEYINTHDFLHPLFEALREWLIRDEMIDYYINSLKDSCFSSEVIYKFLGILKNNYIILSQTQSAQNLQRKVNELLIEKNYLKDFYSNFYDFERKREIERIIEDRKIYYTALGYSRLNNTLADYNYYFLLIANEMLLNNNTEELDKAIFYNPMYNIDPLEGHVKENDFVKY